LASYNWPPSGGGVSIYPTFADFPAGTEAGELAVAADTGDLYEWDGSAWVLLASPSGAGPAPGSTGNMIYNSGGFFAADPDFTTSGSGTVSAVNLTLSGTFTNNLPSGEGSVISALSSLSNITPALQIDASSSTVSTVPLYVIAESNGYNDTHGIEVLWSSGAATAPYESHIFEANIVGTGSSSGNVYGFFCNVIDPGSLTNLYAIGVGPGAGVITQRQGTLAAASYALYYNGSTYSSIKTGTNQIFINDDDYVYIGNSMTFGGMVFNISIFASSSITPVFQYWNGAWTSLPAAANLTDDSAGFTKQGNIYWESYVMSDWTTTTVDSDTAYWIRIQRTAATLTTPPTETSVLSSVITVIFLGQLWERRPK
jgi:hypothetical protein